MNQPCQRAGCPNTVTIGSAAEVVLQMTVKSQQLSPTYQQGEWHYCSPACLVVGAKAFADQYNQA